MEGYRHNDSTVYGAFDKAQGKWPSALCISRSIEGYVRISITFEAFAVLCVQKELLEFADDGGPHHCRCMR